ncbi:hypothetical protein [Vulcanisaeta sp. JCM 16161]|uniref:hypothetical protein n=1 Tax=Vulcanisaeta sp. JCM 16161 TaxID=1295372 RepID=UPI000B0C31A9|nr:hypothetical protein [Vulcanisaeta sp. JCM 16161]
MSIFGIFSVAGLFTAILIWVFVFPYAVYVGKVYGGSRVDFAIKLVSALGIMAFAVYIIIRALLYFV